MEDDALKRGSTGARLRQAVAAHQEGRLDAAREGYEEILRLQPAHFDALHLLGVVAFQRDDAAKSVELIGQAIGISAVHPSAHLNLGSALLALERLEEAVASYDRAIALKPDHAAAWSNRGNALTRLGRPGEALASCDRAIALDPRLAEAHSNRGYALNSLERAEEALASCDRAIALKPALAEAWNNRGNALQWLKRHEEALASYDQAIAIKPGYAEAYSNRAGALSKLKRPDESLASCDRAIGVAPRYAEAWSNRGKALQELKRPDEALAAYDQAIALKPDYPEAHSNRADALRDLARLDEAIAGYDRALAVKPDYAEAWNNRGNALQILQRLDQAIASFERAIELQPDYADAHWNQGLCRLLMGDFEEGWKQYEWRWQLDSSATPPRSFGEPRWSGVESLQGKTILLYPEQGFGDTIQFCRYARLVAERGATVLLEVPKSLRSLLEGLEGVGQVVVKGEALPPFDYQCALMSLPLAFDTRLGTIPAAASYLHADPRKLAQWHGKLGAGTAPRVGLAWSGRPTHKNDHNRSLPLARLLQDIPPHVQCYSLQKDVQETDREVLASRPDIVHFGDELEDFADTAAVVSQMDLVISVDTSVAHLAGALGKPVWVLLPYAPDWRWLLDREDSPWYPSARLFRQAAIGSWDEVLETVRQELGLLKPGSDG